MKVRFEQPVAFSTLTNAFTGDGIPPIPSDARRVKVSDHTTAYISHTGEVWEHFCGVGTTEMSETYYWPALDLCPRDWVQDWRRRHRR